MGLLLSHLALATDSHCMERILNDTILRTPAEENSILAKTKHAIKEGINEHSGNILVGKS